MPIGIVEDSKVADAMVGFANCLSGNCGTRSLKRRSQDISRACRNEIAKGFNLAVDDIPDRPE